MNLTGCKGQIEEQGDAKFELATPPPSLPPPVKLKYFKNL